MFRITSKIEDDELVLKLEGCLAGPWVRELEAYWREAANATDRRRMRVDLTDVCHVDSRGEELMARMYVAGARFVARGCFMPELVREISRTADIDRRK